MRTLKISHPNRKIKTAVRISGSKSESNRALILNALSGGKIAIESLSPARDTQTLQRILLADEKEANVLDAGTTMRFLTAYYAATNQNKIITGSERMLQRPIHPLVNALIDIGFAVHYLGEEGFPPIETHPTNLNKLDSEVWIEGNISSQFITALMLIAPTLANGLTIKFTTELTSKPYIEMTARMLSEFGVKVEWKENSITIAHSPLQAKPFKVGGDWSSASYWYSIAFLADEAEILLEGLQDDWSQGDREIAEWMLRFGVDTEFTADGALIKKVSANYPKMMKLNFKDNPDLAQTFAAMFAAKDVYATFSGIESLKIKETDRVAALHNELLKFNVHFDYAQMYDFYQLKGEFKSSSQPIATYNDHRMAMAFAPLALMGEVEIENPEVVEKSYPSFWSDLEKAGFKIALTQ
ncbi:MAG: hypothetical protein U0V74_15970 [Chitinophagales bacterium]